LSQVGANVFNEWFPNRQFPVITCDFGEAHDACKHQIINDLFTVCPWDEGMHEFIHLGPQVAVIFMSSCVASRVMLP